MRLGRLNIDGPWRIYGAHRNTLGFIFDGDDDPGDPSGLYTFALGWSLGIYWPMHRCIEVSWILGKRPRVVRW